MESIHDLLGQIRKSEILLPEFQRGYVWTRDQARLFVQSLYNDRPTGHFLIWKTYKPSKIRGEAITGDGHSLLLLDGQQRLTSLYTLFDGKPPPFYEGEELFFNLHFNVVTEEFRFWQKTIMEGDPSWISVHGFLSEGIENFIKALPSKRPTWLSPTCAVSGPKRERSSASSRPRWASTASASISTSLSDRSRRWHPVRCCLKARSTRCRRGSPTGVETYPPGAPALGECPPP